MSRIQRIIATVFLVIGLVLLGIGAYLGVVPAIPKEFVATTQATIADITTGYGNTTSNGRQNINYNVFVEYEIEGRGYERMLGYYNSGMAIGQQVEIEYDTRNPNVISSPGGRQFGMIICLALGAVFTALGVILQFKPVPVFINHRRAA
jgi:hypothetical protein